MAVLLNAVTTNTTSDASDQTAPCTVHASGTFSGASVAIQTKTTNTAWKTIHQFRNADAVNVEIHGAYQIRAVADMNDSDGPISVETTED
jgi:hypothetical protein